MKMAEVTKRAIHAARWRKTWLPRKCAECSRRSCGPFILCCSWWDETTRNAYKNSGLGGWAPHQQAYVCMSCWNGVPGVLVRAGAAPYEVLVGVPYAGDSPNWEDIGVFDFNKGVEWCELRRMLEG
jgi:hypothetical protein